MKRFTYESWGLKPVINSQAFMTPIGGSIMPPEVVQAMADAAPYFVDMHALNRKAGEIIARHTGAEAGLVTAGAMSGMLLQAAACMTGTDIAKVHRLPDTAGMKNEILYFHTQRITYFRAFQMAGAKLTPVGEDARVTSTDALEEAITERTAAVAYVFGPRLAWPLSLAEVVAVAHRRGVPVIVDAAAMVPPVENLKRFISEGADLVVFSGGKGIRGPQSTGILCGRHDLIEAAYLNSSPNYECIGRAMKVCKEEIVGLVTALELFVAQDHVALWASWREAAGRIASAVQDIPGLTATVDEDPTLREGPTAVMRVNSLWRGIALRKVRDILISGAPPILVGYHHDGFSSDRDELTVCVENLQEGEEQIVVERLRNALTREG